MTAFCSSMSSHVSALTSLKREAVVNWVNAIAYPLWPSILERRLEAGHLVGGQEIHRSITLELLLAAFGDGAQACRGIDRQPILSCGIGG